MEEDNKKEEQLNKDDEECKKHAEEYLNNWKRERADFLNYKKDETKRLEEFAKFANEDLILEAIELLDDLELAVKELPNVGLEQIVKKFTELFKKYGVGRIDTSGKFDPSLHEAVAVPSDLSSEVLTKEEASGEGRETDPGGEKMLEVRAGYTMHGQVIRPARVKIIK